MKEMQKQGELRLSAIIPVYSGADYLERLVDALDALRSGWVEGHCPVLLDEAIFVDDGAIDGSPDILDELAMRFPWVHVIRLSRNFGQHPATIAGILHSSGDWVVTLDEDLQHHPRDIPRMLSMVAQQSCDVVYARPPSAVHENWFRDLGSRGFKWLMKLLTGNVHIESFNSFRLIRGSIARAAASVCSHETYFDMALSWFNQRVATVTIELKDERVLKGEKSGYSPRKLFSHARRMVVSAHTKALRIGALIGLGALLLAVVYGAVVLVQKLFFPESVDVEGWVSVFLSILLFGGVISFLVSVVLEYIAVILLHIQGKPAFFVVDRSTDKYLSGCFVDDDS